MEGDLAGSYMVHCLWTGNSTALSTVCSSSKQCRCKHTSPCGCIAFSIPSVVSPSLAPAEEKRNILVLYLFLPCTSLCFIGPTSLFPSPCLKQLPGERSPVCCPGWEAPLKVCAHLGGLWVASADLLLHHLAFLYHTAVFQGALVWNMNFVFMPLYAILAEGTLHFKIQINLDVVILTPA